MPNLNSLGPDLVQLFCLKKFSSLQWKVRLQLGQCLDDGFVPSLMTKGRTELLQKDKGEGSITSNCRPITYLPSV